MTKSLMRSYLVAIRSWARASMTIQSFDHWMAPSRSGTERTLVGPPPAARTPYLVRRGPICLREKRILLGAGGMRSSATKVSNWLVLQFLVYLAGYVVSFRTVNLLSKGKCIGAKVGPSQQNMRPIERSFLRSITTNDSTGMTVSLQ